jgi:filamentous hemagglutinin family protein
MGAARPIIMEASPQIHACSPSLPRLLPPDRTTDCKAKKTNPIPENATRGRFKTLFTYCCQNKRTQPLISRVSMKLPTTVADLSIFTRNTVAISVSLSLALTPAMVFSLPQGGVVNAGQATIADGVGRVDIHQASDKAVIDWRGFDLAPGETTEFHQPGSNALTVNRVSGDSASIINGAIKANGNVMVINPNGMVFGGKSNVDVNGLIASTADADNADLMKSGTLNLNKPGKANAAIINQGIIKTKDGGKVGILAPNLSNQGIIEAKLGKVHLASGDTATIDLYGDGLIHAAVSDKVTSQLVENSGIISTEGGSIAITAAAGDQIVDSLINLGGVLDAKSIGNKRGKITVQGDGSNAVKGNKASDKGKKQGSSTVLVSGIIDASGRGAGEGGGNVTVTGDEVALLNGAFIDASGSTGKSGTTDGKDKSALREGSAGGDIRIGGDYLGGGETPTAKNLYVDPGAFILNDAIQSGDAGRSIFWSDGTTQFYGNVFARALGGNGVDPVTGSAIQGDLSPGALAKGDGGFVETSGHGHLDAGGYVDLTASSGKRGTYFLDPTNVTIYGNVTSVYNSGNLAGYWNFDEGAGTTANDTSGNGNNGTLTNGPTWSATVAPTPQSNSQSISFDGVNDYISMPDSNALDIANGSPVSLSVWFNPSALGGKQSILAKGAYAVEWNYGVGFNGGNFFYARHNQGDNLSTGAATAGAWQHLSVVFSGGQDTFYLNGVLVDSVADSGWQELPSTYGLTVGTSFNGLALTYSEFFNGLIDDIRIYNTNLTANDVAELYGSRFTVAGIEKMSQTADVSIQATNNITLDMGGDTIDMTNNRNLTLTAGNDILTASAGTIQATTDGSTANTGNILLSAGRDITLGHDVDLVTTGAGNNADRGTVTLRANNSILFSASGDITTQGGGIILNSDRDSAGGGSIGLNNGGTNLISNGGNVTMGGGATPATGQAVGVAGSLYGVSLNGATVNTAAGNMIVNGTGYSNAGTGNLDGVYVVGNAVLQSTSGNITVNGIGGSGTSWNAGVHVNGSTITTATGAITLNGTGGASTAGFGTGILLDGTSSILSTGTGAGAGTINLLGQGGPVGGSATGLSVYGTAISSVDGAINITGAQGAGGGYSMFLHGTNNILSTGSAPITMTSTNGDMSLAYWAGNTHVIGGPSATGPITFNTDLLNPTIGGTLTIQTSGSVNVVPRTTGRTVGIAGGAGALGVVSPIINSITAGQLNIGRSDGTGAVTVAANTWNNNTKLFTGTTGITFTGAQNAGTKDFTIDGNINGFYNLDITAGTIGFTGNIGNVTPLSNVTLNAANALTLPSINAATIFARTTGAGANITIGSGKTLTATGAGTSLTLAAGGNFINGGGASALSTASGRWLVFTKDDANTTSGLSAAFIKYGCPYTTPCAYPSTGNGFLFAGNPAASGSSGGGGTSIPFSDPVITTVFTVPVVNAPATPAPPAEIATVTPPANPVAVVQESDSDFPSTVERVSIDLTPATTTNGFDAPATFQSVAASRNERPMIESVSSPVSTANASDAGDAQPMTTTQEGDNRSLSVWEGLLTIAPELARRLGLHGQDWE